MRDNEIETAWRGPPQCEHCAIRHLVLFADLNREDFARIHGPVDELRFEAGEPLYQPADPPRYVFTIREGLVKLVQYLPDGTQRIVRLLRQGDLAGMEALVGQPYQHAAVALAPVDVCRIPTAVVKHLNLETPKLYRELMNRWQRALSEADRWLTELSTGPARQRIARLILRLAQTPDGRFRLPSREDIGAMLAITPETASRTIADLRRKGLLRRLPDQSLIAEMDGLREIAEG